MYSKPGPAAAVEQLRDDRRRELRRLRVLASFAAVGLGDPLVDEQPDRCVPFRIQGASHGFEDHSYPPVHFREFIA